MKECAWRAIQSTNNLKLFDVQQFSSQWRHGISEKKWILKNPKNSAACKMIRVSTITWHVLFAFIRRRVQVKRIEIRTHVVKETDNESKRYLGASVKFKANRFKMHQLICDWVIQSESYDFWESGLVKFWLMFSLVHTHTHKYSLLPCSVKLVWMPMLLSIPGAPTGSASGMLKKSVPPSCKWPCPSCVTSSSSCCSSSCCTASRRACSSLGEKAW